jgi:hypothetical protein
LDNFSHGQQSGQFFAQTFTRTIFRLDNFSPGQFNQIKMADFGSLIFEKFSKINDKTFFQSSNGFVFGKDQTLLKIIIIATKMVTKNQNAVTL